MGALPLLFLPLMARAFADDPSMLLKRHGEAVLRTVLVRVGGGRVIPDDLEVGQQSTKAGSVPVRELFGQGRALGTLMIWVAFFMCLLMINGVTVWLPQLMVQAGYALGSSLIFMIVLNVGAIVGTLFMGQLADRFGVKRVLVPMFVVAAVSLALLGFGAGMTVLLALVVVAGACTMGAQNISYGFVSQYYPSFMRSTAIGLASAVGRIGAIMGPLFGGVLLTIGLPVQANFLFFAVPGVIAGLAFFFVPLIRDAGSGAADEDLRTAAR